MTAGRSARWPPPHSPLSRAFRSAPGPAAAVIPAGRTWSPRRARPRRLAETGPGDGHARHRRAAAVADVGAGGGWFTVRLARRVGPNGVVYAQDVQQQMLDSIRRRVDREGFKNVFYIRGERLDPKLPKAGLDAVLMVDTSTSSRTPWRCCVAWASRSSPGGRVGIVDFRSDGGGPGPAVQRAREGRARGGTGGGSRAETARTRDVPGVSVPPDLRQVTSRRILSAATLLVVKPRSVPGPAATGDGRARWRGASRGAYAWPRRGRASWVCLQPAAGDRTRARRDCGGSRRGRPCRAPRAPARGRRESGAARAACRCRC